MILVQDGASDPPPDSVAKDLSEKRLFFPPFGKIVFNSVSFKSYKVMYKVKILMDFFFLWE